MRFSNYLNEKTKALKANVKKKINKEISKLLEPTYFRKIPLEDIFNILDKYGVVVLQEDQTEWSGLLAGGVKDTEQVSFDLGWKESKDSDGRYEVIPRANLVLTYYKMPRSGKYEVVSYVG